MKIFYISEILSSRFKNFSLHSIRPPAPIDRFTPAAQARAGLIREIYRDRDTERERVRHTHRARVNI